MCFAELPSKLWDFFCKYCSTYCVHLVFRLPFFSSPNYGVEHSDEEVAGERERDPQARLDRPLKTLGRQSSTKTNKKSTLFERKKKSSATSSDKIDQLKFFSFFV